MTEKQENILAVALRLFAQQGYENTPTSQIAKEAKVSEGLVFRHFESKEGLLLALLEQGQIRIKKWVDIVIQEPNPKDLISRTIDLTAQLISEEREFWALQFTLKYKSQHFAKLKKQSEPMQVLYVALLEAFKSLNYANPQKEAELLIIVLEGLSSTLLAQDESLDILNLLSFIKSKYAI